MISPRTHEASRRVPPAQPDAQRLYYAGTAAQYDAMHVRPDDEHALALAWLAGLAAHLGARTVLDVGSGTGRALHYLRVHQPRLRVVGIEPSAELRAVGHASGLEADVLVDGDATRLAYADASVDIVCEFGVLHHLARPRAAVAEMLRVARLGVFISDDNHFAAGSSLLQRVKRGLSTVGLWRAAYWLRQGGKHYRISDGDGLSYPYSVFDDLAYVRSRCDTVTLSAASGASTDLRRCAPHVALFGRMRVDHAPLP